MSQYDASDFNALKTFSDIHFTVPMMIIVYWNDHSCNTFYNTLWSPSHYNVILSYFKWQLGALSNEIHVLQADVIQNRLVISDYM